MDKPKVAARACLQSTTAWRREAGYLRAHATLPHLTDKQRDMLLREADAAERQANMWLAGAIATR